MSAIVVVPPRVAAVPLIVTVPHAGRELPPALADELRVSVARLRQLEDPWMDTLLDAVPRAGGWLVTTHWARAVADVNRGGDEFAFAGPVPGWRATGKARVGLGVVPTRLAGAPIYARPLDPTAVAARVALAHTPYHDALAGLVDEVCARFGEAFVLDGHSMPDSAQAAGLPTADVVLGDRWGRAAEAAWTGVVDTALAREGFVTTRNRPYAGGYITCRHGRPEAGVHAIQLECRRGLYMDEGRFVPRATFDDFHRRLGRVIHDVAGQLAARAQVAFALAGE